MTMEKPLTIRMIVGHEPRRDGEYPTIFDTRSTTSCSSIEEQHDLSSNIIWFLVRDYNGKLIRKINALAVAEVHYE